MSYGPHEGDEAATPAPRKRAAGTPSADVGSRAQASPATPLTAAAKERERLEKELAAARQKELSEEKRELQRRLTEISAKLGEASASPRSEAAA